MINQTLSMDAFRKVCEDIWPVPDPDAPVRTRNNHTRRRTHLDALFGDADTQAGIRGTAWAGWQAVVEYLDHYTPAGTPERRAERVLTSTSVARIKQHAHDLLTTTTT